MNPEIKSTRYVLAVRNLQKSVDFYKEKMGCKTDWEAYGWHQLSRGNFIVMLGECSDDVDAFETRNHSYFAYIDVDNIDGLHAELASRGVEIPIPLGDRSWGMREFGIQTVDGHRIMFGKKIG